MCISQIRIKKKATPIDDKTYVDVPCGKCGFCLQNRRKEWSFRLQKEWRQHESSAFLTLTYRDSELVWGTCDSGTFAVLNKCDWQNFVKRLRKKQAAVGDRKLKYYAVGEYGSKTNRPHYHALMFGMYPEIKAAVENTWGLGSTHCGEVNLDSIDYITSYVVNRVDKQHYMVPPFSSISNGIGLAHLEQNRELYGRVSTVRNVRGYNQRLPRYYREKLDKNRWKEAERVASNSIEYELKRALEVERLARTYPNPEGYLEERDIANSNRVLRSSKNNHTF